MAMSSSPTSRKRTVDLAPALVLAAQLLFGVLFGLMGLLLADPIVATIKVSLEEWSKRRAGGVTVAEAEPPSLLSCRERPEVCERASKPFAIRPETSTPEPSLSGGYEAYWPAGGGGRRACCICCCIACICCCCCAARIAALRTTWTTWTSK